MQCRHNWGAFNHVQTLTEMSHLNYKYSINCAHLQARTAKNCSFTAIRRGKSYRLKCTHRCVENKEIYLNSTLWKLFNKKKNQTVTSQPASSLSSARQSESVFPLSSPSDVCRGQTVSPAAGRLQTIVLIPLSCSLPTNLPDYHPCSSSPFVSAGLPSQNRAANRRKRKKRERKLA